MYHGKRFKDILLSMVLIVVFSPFLIIVYIALKLTSPYSPIFSQERIGYKQKPFLMYKFRTMRPGNHEEKHQSVVKKQALSEPSRRKEQKPILGKERRQTSHKMNVSPHLLPFGNILRKLSLDELPQLFNVFKGDMSLVGPRPPIDYELKFHTDKDLQRLNTYPGITGLWQISGRSFLNYREMINLDLEYIKKQSFLLDIKILYKTITVIFQTKKSG